MPKYFDIHSHLNFPEYDADRDAVLARMKEQDTWTITVGTNLETSTSAVVLAEKNEGVFAVIGVHPIDDPKSIFDVAKFAQLVSSPKVVAIGECGLDYSRLPDGAENADVRRAEIARQKALFEQQVQFALDHDKALMLHCRNAYIDVLTILEAYKKVYSDKLRGNAHFFAGDWEQALRFIAIGFTVSFTGVITFARSYDEVLTEAPIEMILSETDAPYVAPIPYRGKRNEPNYVSEVVKKIAEIKGLDIEKTAQILVQNARRIFKISS